MALVNELVLVLVGLVGGWVTSYAFWRRAQSKTVDYIVKSDSSLVTDVARDTGTPHLRLTWAGRVLDSPRVVVLRIVNSGYSSVRAEDFARPLRVKYRDAEVIDCAVVGAAREVPEPPSTLRTSPTEYEVQPVLLNRQTWIDVRLIVNGPEGEAQASCLLAEQSRAMREVQSPDVQLRQDRVLSWSLRLAVLAFAAFLIAAVGVVVTADPPPGQEPFAYAAFAWQISFTTAVLISFGAALTSLFRVILQVKRLLRYGKLVNAE